MGFGIKFEVWGDYALFSRPELKVERVSYDVITPSAARGILEAVFWKPGLKYSIDKIHVLSPIQFMSIRRNEVSSKIVASHVSAVMHEKEPVSPLFLATSENIAQRSSVLLKNPHYIIEAHFEMTDQAGANDSPEKYYAMICRRLRKGQHYHQPYLGCREFPASFRLYEENEIPVCYANETRDLGLMLLDLDYSKSPDITPIFFRAVLENGTIDVQNSEVFQ